MRQIRVYVSDDRREELASILDDEGIDYVRYRSWLDGERGWLFECPVPSDAVGYVLDRLDDDVDLEAEEYVVVSSVETARTARSEALLDRFADDFDPLSRPELRSKARDMSQDPTSFVWMIFLSAIIATAGLLVSSPAIVVGSMVIAPIVGPVLTASVGAVTGDREMFVSSVRLQAIGLAVAIVGAGAFALVLRSAGFFPATLDLNSIDLIALRVAPGVTTIAVGLAAGAAGAWGLATKGPTSLIGVMIAAALIPAAATVGIAAAWREYRIAVGSLLLLLLTMVLINLGSLAVLERFGYRSGYEGWSLPSNPSTRQVAVIVAAVALVLVVAVLGAASYQQIAFERTVSEEVEATLDDPEYDAVDPVSIRIQYEGAGPFASPETITVTASYTGEGDPPRMAGELEDRIVAATGEDVVVRVRVQQYQRSDRRSLRPAADVSAPPERHLPARDGSS